MRTVFGLQKNVNVLYFIKRISVFLHNFCFHFCGLIFLFLSVFFSFCFAEGAPQLLYKFIDQTMQPGTSMSLKCK